MQTIATLIHAPYCKASEDAEVSRINCCAPPSFVALFGDGGRSTSCASGSVSPSSSLGSFRTQTCPNCASGRRAKRGPEPPLISGTQPANCRCQEFQSAFDLPAVAFVQITARLPRSRIVRGQGARPSLPNGDTAWFPRCRESTVGAH